MARLGVRAISYTTVINKKWSFGVNALCDCRRDNDSFVGITTLDFMDTIST